MMLFCNTVSFNFVMQNENHFKKMMKNSEILSGKFKSAI